MAEFDIEMLPSRRPCLEIKYGLDETVVLVETEEEFCDTAVKIDQAVCL